MDESESARPAKQPRAVKAGACDACKQKKKSCKRPGDDRSVQCEYCTKTNQACTVTVRDQRETTANRDKLVALLAAFKTANAEYRSVLAACSGEMFVDQADVSDARGLIASGQATARDALDALFVPGLDWVSASPGVHVPLFASEVPDDMAKSTLPQIRNWGEQLRRNAYPHIERLHRLLLRVCRGQCQGLNLSETLASDETLFAATDGWPLAEGDLAAVQGYKEKMDGDHIATPPRSPTGPNVAAAASVPAVVPAPAPGAAPVLVPVPVPAAVPAAASASQLFPDIFNPPREDLAFNSVFAQEFARQNHELTETPAWAERNLDPTLDFNLSLLSDNVQDGIPTAAESGPSPSASGPRSINLEQIDPRLLGNQSPESLAGSGSSEGQDNVAWNRPPPHQNEATATPWDGNNGLRWPTSPTPPTTPPDFVLPSPTLSATNTPSLAADGA